MDLIEYFVFDPNIFWKITFRFWKLQRDPRSVGNFKLTHKLFMGIMKRGFINLLKVNKCLYTPLWFWRPNNLIVNLEF